jgi:hypothetical protein
MDSATFTCGNCGRVLPVAEAVHLSVAERVLSFVPFGLLPARVCRSCTGQVSAAVLISATLAMGVGAYCVYWLLSRAGW